MSEYSFTDEEDHSTSPQTNTSFRNFGYRHHVLSFSPSTRAQECQQRKEAFLREKTAILRQRNEDTQSKALEARRRRQAFQAVASSHMLMQIAEAKKRRLRHLEEVKERARILRHYALRKEASNRKDFSEVLEERDMSPGSLPRSPGACDQSTQFQDVPLAKVKIIQRAVRRYQLQLAWRNKSCFDVIGNVLGIDVNFPYAMDVIRKSPNPLNNLFLAMGLPTSGPNGYSWAMYGIVLVSEFQDSVRGLCDHPGFNVNIPKQLGPKQMNWVSLHLPALVYHATIRLLTQLKQILALPFQDILLPISILRLRFARSWRTYHYLFSIYKHNHLSQLKLLADHASSINNVQQRILLDQGVATDSLQTHLKVINHTMVHLSFIPADYSVPWALMGYSRYRLIYEILQTSHAYLKTKKIKGPCYGVSFDPSQVHNGDSVVSFLVDNADFSIPPGISTLKWRKFWYQKFRDDLKTQSLGVPISLRSGRRFTRSKPIHVITGTDLMELGNLEHLQPVALGSNNVVDLKELDSELRSLFEKYYEYCQHIGEISELTPTRDSYNELRSLYRISATSLECNKLTADYFRLVLLLLKQVLQYSGVDVKEVEQLVDGIKEYHSFFDNLLNVCGTLETALFAKWVSYCQPQTLARFQLFENTYQFTTLQIFRGSLGTDFPHIRFRGFYQFIYNNSRHLFKGQFKPQTTILATEQGPQFDKAAPDENASLFFRSVFVDFLTNDANMLAGSKLLKHSIAEIQLMVLFEEAVTRLTVKTQALTVASWISSMLNLSARDSRALYHSFATTADYQLPKSVHLSQFQQRYWEQSLCKLQGPDRVLNLFAAKMQAALLDELGQAKYRNFRALAGELQALQSEISSICDEFYMLYRPILNWIYLDLGRPSHK